jgi:hypothetical protein
MRSEDANSSPPSRIVNRWFGRFGSEIGNRKRKMSAPAFSPPPSSRPNSWIVRFWRVVSRSPTLNWLTSRTTHDLIAGVARREIPPCQDGSHPRQPSEEGKTTDRRNSLPLHRQSQGRFAPLSTPWSRIMGKSGALHSCRTYQGVEISYLAPTALQPFASCSSPFRSEIFAVHLD